jgi:hypothetical protein
MEQELAIKLQDNGIHYQTQVEIPVTTADFYFPLETRQLLVFVDGRVHLGTAQMVKDEELRSLLRKRGYRILELQYENYSDKTRDWDWPGLGKETGFLGSRVGSFRRAVFVLSPADRAKLDCWSALLL